MKVMLKTKKKKEINTKTKKNLKILEQSPNFMYVLLYLL